MTNSTDKIASKFLGKRVKCSEFYNPSLLLAVPRKDNRLQYKIDDKCLPFLGCDVWHAYEFSAITTKGLPVTRLLKLKYDCCSEYIVESKSLKLYLNSFNMTGFGNNVSECLDICKKTIREDLSRVLKTEVDVNFMDNDSKISPIFQNFVNILSYVNEDELVIDKFKESPELLEVEKNKEKREYFLMFDSLRSNCRVTHQPDFGDIFIYYESLNHFKEDSLVKYLSSFRSEFHFHEECCEMVYKRLYDLLNENDKLFVCALYTRRGGIDISPVRWSKNTSTDDVSDLLDVTQFARYGLKQ